jgi:ankyrin repeat protein
MPTTSLNNEVYEGACYARSIPLFEVLLSQGLDLNAHSSEYCGDALNLAVSEGDVQFAKWLLEHGQDPNREVGGFGSMSTVCRAVGGSHPSVLLLELLIEYGARVRDTGAIIAAAKIGNVDAVEVLLDNGVDIEEREWSFLIAEVESKGTALVTACREGKEAVVELLLRRGANSDAVDDGGRSCLGLAIKGEYDGIVKRLEEKGAKNRNGDILKKES